MAPKERSLGAVPGGRLGGRGRRSRAAAGADLLAGRRRAAHHLGAHGDARPAQGAPEPRHLPPAGDRPQQADHALARAPRRRARLSRSRAAQPGEPFPVAVALGADPATMLARRDAGARHAVANTSSRACCAARGPRSSNASAATCRCPRRRDRARGRDPAGRDRAMEGPIGDHTGYYNEAERFPVFTVERITHAPRRRSTTRPTPASRPTSRRCSAWR